MGVMLVGRKLINRYQNHHKMTILQSVELQLHKEQWNACNNRGHTTGLPWHSNFRDFTGQGLYKTSLVQDFTQW